MRPLQGRGLVLLLAEGAVGRARRAPDGALRGFRSGWFSGLRSLMRRGSEDRGVSGEARSGLPLALCVGAAGCAGLIGRLL